MTAPRLAGRARDARLHADRADDRRGGHRHPGGDRAAELPGLDPQGPPLRRRRRAERRCSRRRSAGAATASTLRATSLTYGATDRRARPRRDQLEGLLHAQHRRAGATGYTVTATAVAAPRRRRRQLPDGCACAWPAATSTTARPARRRLRRVGHQPVLGRDDESRTRGFTLIELMIAIAVVAVLATGAGGAVVRRLHPGAAREGHQRRSSSPTCSSRAARRCNRRTRADDAPASTCRCLQSGDGWRDDVLLQHLHRQQRQPARKCDCTQPPGCAARGRARRKSAPCRFPSSLGVRPSLAQQPGARLLASCRPPAPCRIWPIDFVSDVARLRVRPRSTPAGSCARRSVCRAGPASARPTARSPGCTPC